jgi:hypothetical protein
MAIQIEVQDAHAKLLVEFYIQRLQVLRGEINEREKEIKSINSTIQSLKKAQFNGSVVNPGSTNVNLNTNYSNKWPWVKKVQFAIESQNRPLTTKEIVETLTEFEPEFIFDRKRAVASISSILSSKSGDNKEFIRIESESGEFAYAMNEPASDEDVDDLFS